MKCPQCNYVSFDSMPRCKKCGFQFKQARAQEETIDMKSLFSEVHVKSKETTTNDESSNLKKAVSSIRESLDEIEGRGRAGKGEALQDQSLIVDTDEFRFRVDSGYIDTAKQFPDHDEVNWEDSVSLSNHDLTLPLHDDVFEDTEQDHDLKRVDDSSARTDRFKGELRQISEELKEIEAEPVPALSADVLNSRDGADAMGAASKGGFWIRAVAYLIDTVILYLLAIILTVVGIIALGIVSSGLGELDEERILGLMGPLYLFNTIITIVYFTYFHGSIGQTPGKMLCRLKVVRINGESLGYGRAFLRWMGYLPSSFVLCLGFLWAGWDKHKQAWHDKIAGTYVVKLNKP